MKQRTTNSDPTVDRRTSHQRWWLVLVMASLLTATGFTACGSAYHDVQEDWTRHEEAYEAFGSRAFVWATLKTKPFRHAFIEEYSRLFALTPDQKAALVEAELAEHKVTLVAIVALFTPDVGWNDLSPASGFWEVRLERTPTSYSHPRNVRRLLRSDPTWKRMYPYATSHYTLYELQFDREGVDGQPVAVPGQALHLVVAGAPAKIRMSWTMP
ncbi:MAG: hypothetical protein ACI9MR_003608 [Myxococcota bacterium]|jgi:hypothetical protein